MEHPLGKSKLAVLALSLWAFAAPCAGAELNPLDRFTSPQKQALLQGQPVYEYKKSGLPGDQSQGYGQAEIIVNAPVDVCFEIFSRLDQQNQYFPHKTKSEVVKSAGNRVWLKNEFYFYIGRVEYTSRYNIDRERRRFDFEMDKSYPHNIPESAGYFQFEKIDDRRTLFTYAATKLDTGFHVPQVVQGFVTSRDLPGQAVNVKKRIESGGKWTTADK
jgi:hypothetical protein